MAKMIYPGERWLDTDGHAIEAHGGCMLYHEGVYYWYGENKAGITRNRRIDVVGVSCYSSTDLLRWKNEGLVLPAVPIAGHDLNPCAVVERPKVLYNAQTGKFVLWLHIDDATYHKASVGVALSDSPTGPFTYLGSFRPNGVDSRDMTLFQDENGHAYLIHSSDWNRTTVIAPLTEDYLACTGSYTRVFVDQTREAPAVFRKDGRYYMITSYCTGWDPNPALYARSEQMLGHWSLVDNPCEGPGKFNTYASQSAFVFRLQGTNQYIFMADRWNPDDLSDSRYVWLPILWEGPYMRIPWRDAWSPEEFL